MKLLLMMLMILLNFGCASNGIKEDEKPDEMNSFVFFEHGNEPLPQHYGQIQLEDQNGKTYNAANENIIVFKLPLGTYTIKLFNGYTSCKAKESPSFSVGRGGQIIYLGTIFTTQNKTEANLIIRYKIKVPEKLASLPIIYQKNFCEPAGLIGDNSYPSPLYIFSNLNGAMIKFKKQFPHLVENEVVNGVIK